MAFTAAEYPSQDKEHAFLWDPSDVTTDFFDQFTVDDAVDNVDDTEGGLAEPWEGNGGEFRGDGGDSSAHFEPTDFVASPSASSANKGPRSIVPPSSSRGRSSGPDFAPVPPQGTPRFSAHHHRRKVPQPNTQEREQRKKLPLTGAIKPPPEALSVSEPDKLGLDGLSMQSPGIVAFPPGATHVAPSSPARTRQDSNKKHGRLESLYSTIRNKAATLRPRSKKTTRPGVSSDEFTSPVKSERRSGETHEGSSSNIDISGDANNDDYTHHFHFHNYNDLDGVSDPSLPPTSRPMATSATARLPHDGSAAMGPSFVGGYVDDPFCAQNFSGLPTTDSFFYQAMTSNSEANLHNGRTNWLFSDPFGHDAVSQAEGETATQWNTSFTTSFGDSSSQDAWWDPMGSSSQPAASGQAYQTTDAKNATFNLAMHLDPSNMGAEYGLADHVAPDDLSARGSHGAIRMPHPHYPHSAALLSNELAANRQPPFHARGEDTTHNHQPQQQQQQQFHHAYSDQLAPSNPPPSASACTPSPRRPKPRAPSSGARYHQLGALTSPRKPRGRSTSSASPSPTQNGGSRNRATSRSRQHSQQRQQLRRSSSMQDMVTNPPPSLRLQPPPPSYPSPAPTVVNVNQPTTMENIPATLPTAAPAIPASHSLSSFKPVNSVQKRRSWSHARRTASTSSSLSSAVEPQTPESGGRVSLPSAAAPMSAPASGRGRRRASEGFGGGGGGRGRSPEKATGRGSVSSGAAKGSVSSISSSGSMGGGIGFVNFTPDDGTFLMTGVAPSGSSKTKARREREAAERQRRLSEAVMQAVAAAGGDIARLREEGIMLSG